MDWVIIDELQLTVGDVIGYLSAGAMIVGGVLPYVPQYNQIRKTQDAEGFSLHVCLALLIANTLRILFWFGKQYELPLLIQSIIMNITMFVMVHLCVSVRNRNQLIKAKDRLFSDFERKYFWDWTDFYSYLDFIIFFAMVFALLMYLLVDVALFVELIGFLAVFTEAMLGAPQFLRNYRNKSTEGMSIPMVVMWTCGDLFKTTYFILRDAPMQFWICGTLQVSLDLAILSQVYMYRKQTDAASTKSPKFRQRSLRNVPD